MALTQLGQIAMMTTDLVLIGRLGDAALAAAALAHTVLFAAFTVGMGLVSAVAPLAAQAYGAREPRMVRRALRVGLWAAFMLGVPVTLVQFWGEAILIALGQAPEAAALAGRYLAGMAWAILPAWVFIALRNFMGAVNRPEPALWITLVAIPVNAGAGLCPDLRRLRSAGARPDGRRARHRARRRGHVRGRHLDRLHAPPLQEVPRARTRSGVPTGGCSPSWWRSACRSRGALLLEYGLFAAAALLMGRISTSAVAAHQIALQVAAILYMVPFGIATAATVRVGQAVGRRDRGRHAPRRICGAGARRRRSWSP